MTDLTTAERTFAEDRAAPRSEHQKTVQRLVALYEAWVRATGTGIWRAAPERP